MEVTYVLKFLLLEGSTLYEFLAQFGFRLVLNYFFAPGFFTDTVISVIKNIILISSLNVSQVFYVPTLLYFLPVEFFFFVDLQNSEGRNKHSMSAFTFRDEETVSLLVSPTMVSWFQLE